jgi:hypothetical protein
MPPQAAFKATFADVVEGVGPEEWRPIWGTWTPALETGSARLGQHDHACKHANANGEIPTRAAKP